MRSLNFNLFDFSLPNVVGYIRITKPKEIDITVSWDGGRRNLIVESTVDIVRFISVVINNINE